jgi:sulfoxide reductase catalytic subunit YedY
MHVRRGGGIKSSEITPYGAYLDRRRFMAGLAGMAVGISVGAQLDADPAAAAEVPSGAPLKATPNPAFKLDDKPTPFKDVTSYNNFYEFGLDKDDPAKHAHLLKTRPWTVQVEGHVKKARTYDIDDLLKLAPMEERVYSLRCVEAWSMVIPWIGYPLSALIKAVEPTGQAKYVEFQTLVNPEMFPGQRKGFFGSSLDWPYTEGLRMDEAMHPLALLTFGLYGQVLPNQNGAPLRIVVPWKYGFKSGKSLVKIRFVTEEPRTTWNKSAPQEYGFYSNVNPEVSHPRWSQATERRIGEFRRRETKMFNGYADQVASLYTGMDLKKFY